MRREASRLPSPQMLHFLCIATDRVWFLGIKLQSLQSCDSPRVQSSIDEALHYWSAEKKVPPRPTVVALMGYC